MTIFGSLSAVYIIPTIYTDYRNLDNVAKYGGARHDLALPAEDVQNQNAVGPSTSKADAFARHAIDSIRDKASALYRNYTV